MSSHIADKVAAQLEADGWKSYGWLFTKPMKGGGALAGDGVEVVQLNLCEVGERGSKDHGYILVRSDGWGRTYKHVDLRNFSDAKEAIEAVIVGDVT